jgi:hypothetical protein
MPGIQWKKELFTANCFLQNNKKSSNYLEMGLDDPLHAWNNKVRNIYISEFFFKIFLCLC